MRLQSEVDEETGLRVLTCYLLPQQPHDDRQGTVDPACSHRAVPVHIGVMYTCITVFMWIFVAVFCRPVAVIVSSLPVFVLLCAIDL